MIAGVINDMDYWYFDAYFNDTEGMGLSVFGALTLQQWKEEFIDICPTIQLIKSIL